MSSPAVLPGRNVWIWARSDSDAPSAADVRLGAAQTMLRALPDTGCDRPSRGAGDPGRPKPLLHGPSAAPRRRGEPNPPHAPQGRAKLD